MKGKRLLFLCLCLLFPVAQMQAGFWDRLGFQTKNREACPTIRVLLERDIDGCMLEIRGRYNIFDPRTNERVSTRFIPKGNFLQPIAEGIRWGEQFPGLYQLHFVPDSKDTTLLINGVEYRGSLYVYQVEGALNIVNEIFVEDYVHSILANQVSDLPDEALAAVAIAARTEAMYRVEKPVNPYYHVAADEVGYEGYSVTSIASPIHQSMVATKNLVLSYTRAFEGSLDPVMTDCLKGLYGKGESRWDSLRAKDMAEEGRDAKQIIAEMYPEASIELMRG